MDRHPIRQEAGRAFPSACRPRRGGRDRNRYEVTIEWQAAGVQVYHCLQAGKRLRLGRVNEGIACRIPASARVPRASARKIVGLIALGIGRDPPDDETQAYAPLCIFASAADTRPWPSMVSTRSAGRTPPKAGNGSASHRAIDARASKFAGSPES